jgi:LytS/YehU family sensor histidine kinase
MELMEGIRTSKEIYTNSNELALAERSLIRTRMDPVFMMHSLDGIIRLSEQKSALAPGSVVGFSDILRYRLYRSQEPLVPLPEELDYLEKLFLFTNTLNNDSRCSLEVQGQTGPQQWLPPLSVINIAETLINTRKAEDETWSLLLYLLAEEKELQIAAELQTGLELVESMEDVRKNLELVFGVAVIFAVEKNDNTYSLRICLPLRSNAS